MFLHWCAALGVASQNALALALRSKQRSNCYHLCRIQAAQAAATPATALTNALDAQPSMDEEPPPLPPLPPDEEAQPPPPPAGPPFAPAPPPLPTAQASFQSASTIARQSRWQQPEQVSRQQVTAVTSNAYPPPHWSGSSRLQANGTDNRFSAAQVKMEDGVGASFGTLSAAVKTEAAGTTGRTAQMSSGKQQAQQSAGAVQFGFSGTGKPAGKVNVYCHLTIKTRQM